MEQLANFLVNFLQDNVNELMYLVTTCIVTFIFLAYVFKSPTKRLRIYTNIVCGLVLGGIWMLLADVKATIMIFCFTSTVAFYEWIIKAIAKKVGFDYNNDKGII